MHISLPRRLATGFLYLTLGLLVTTAVGLKMLLHSPQVLPLLLRLAQANIPGTLEVTSITGHLGGPVIVEGINYEYAGLGVKIARLSLDWDLIRLASFSLVITDLKLHQLAIHLPPTADHPPPASPLIIPELLLPITIDLQHVSIKDLTVSSSPNAIPEMWGTHPHPLPPLWQATHVGLAAQASGDSIAIKEFAMVMPKGTLHTNGHLRLTKELPIALQVNWTYQLTSGVTAAGTGSLQGDMTTLHLTQTLQSPLASTLTAKITAINGGRGGGLLFSSSPQWQAQLQFDNLALTPLIADPTLANVLLTGQLYATNTTAMGGVGAGASLTSPINLQGQVAVQHPRLGSIHTNIAATYDGKMVQIQKLSIMTPLDGQVTITGQYTPTQDQRFGDTPRPHLGQFTAQLQWRNLRWPLHGATTTSSVEGAPTELVQSPQGELHIIGQPNAYNYRLAASLLTPYAPALTVKMRGSGNLQGLTTPRLSIKLPNGQLSATAAVTWTPELSWDAKVQGQGLNPAILQADFPGQLALSLSTQGRISNGKPRFNTKVQHLTGVLRGYPLQAVADLQIDGDSLQINRLEIKSANNRLQANGKVGQIEDVGDAPAPTLPVLDMSWVINADNLKALWPGLAGAVEGQGQLGGNYQAPKLKAKISALGLTYNPKPTNSSISPQIGDVGTPHAPHFAGVKPALLHLDKLSATVNLDMGGIGVSPTEQIGVRRGSLTDELAAAQLKPIDIDFQAKNLTIAGQHWASAAVKAKGTTAAHKLHLTLKGSKTLPNGQLTINAKVRHQQLWQGNIKQLQLSIPKLGNWQLQQAVNFILGTQQQHLDEMCLEAKTGIICANFTNPSLAENTATLPSAPQRGWQGRVHATNVALNLLRPWLPPTIDLVGNLQLQASLQGDATFAMYGNSVLTIPEGVLFICTQATDATCTQVADTAMANTSSTLATAYLHKPQVLRLHKPQTLLQSMVFSGAKLDLSLDHKGASGILEIPWHKLGMVKAELKLPGFAAKPLLMGDAAMPSSSDIHTDRRPHSLEQQVMTGRIQAQIPDLGFVTALQPQLAKVQGHVLLDYQLAGHLMTPQITGQAVVHGDVITIPALGLNIQDVKLQAVADGPELHYQWVATSGKGLIKLTGTTTLTSEIGPMTELALVGENWQVVDIPEAQITISPQLTIHHQAQRVDVDGTILIPTGRVQLQSLPTTAVVNSQDLVILEETLPENTKPLMDWHAQVRLRLSDKISFEGFGLRAKPTGELLLLYEPKRPLLGRGRISITAGSFRAYGQDLTIQHGYLLFADTPLDNPGLNLQAARVLNDITAGVKLTGTIKRPQLNLFSKPTLSQNDILSYIVVGRPMNAARGALGRAELAAVLANSGLGQLTTKMARHLGLDELRVTTDSSGAAAVTAGTYVTPQLYLQHASTPGARESTTSLRYDLTDRLQLQTTTGKAQGIDLFYSIER